jgi:hypothetical protein
LPLAALEPLAGEKCVCACGRHVIDVDGDHIYSFKKHTVSTKAAHETILDTLEAVCHQAGISTEHRNIPSVRTLNGKMGRGDFPGTLDSPTIATLSLSTTNSAATT